jgi:Tol biopolymer transport system component
MNTDGGNLVKVTDRYALNQHPVFTSDGNCIIFDAYVGENNYDIFKYDIHTKKIDDLSRAEFFEIGPHIINRF